MKKYLGCLLVILGLGFTPNVASAGLVAYYDFNQSSGASTLPDLTSNNLDGTLTNMDPNTDWVSGRPGAGNALNFDGTSGLDVVSDGIDDRVSVPDTTASPFDLTDAITVSAWIRPTTTLIHHKRFLEKDLGTAWYFGSASSAFPNAVSIFVGGTEFVTPTNVYATNTWSHVAFAYDRFGAAGQEVRIFVNGSLAATGSYTTPIGVANGEVSIGSYHLGTNVFPGDLDDISIWDRALSDTEMNTLFQSGVTAISDHGLGAGGSSSVPEPGSVVLLLVGLAGVIAARRENWDGC